jgi:hypothetical protein
VSEHDLVVPLKYKELATPSVTVSAPNPTLQTTIYLEAAEFEVTSESLLVQASVFLQTPSVAVTAEEIEVRGPVSLSLVTATLSITAEEIEVRGPVSLSLDTATVSVSSPAVILGLPVLNAEIVVSALPLTVKVTSYLATPTLSITAEELEVRGPISVTLETAELEVGVLPGSLLRFVVELDTASLAVEALVQEIYEYVSVGSQTAPETGRKIPYDYTLDFSDVLSNYSAVCTTYTSTEDTPSYVDVVNPELANLNSGDYAWAGLTVPTGDSFLVYLNRGVSLSGFYVVADAVPDKLILEYYDGSFEQIPSPSVTLVGDAVAGGWFNVYSFDRPYNDVVSIQLSNDSGVDLTVFNAHFYYLTEETPTRDDTSITPLEFLDTASGNLLPQTSFYWENVIAGSSADTSFRIRCSDNATITLAFESVTSSPSIDTHHYLSLDGRTWASTLTLDLLSYQLSNAIRVLRVTPLDATLGEASGFRITARSADLSYAAAFDGYYEAVTAGQPTPHLWHLSPTMVTLTDQVELIGHGMGESATTWMSYVVVEEGTTNSVAPTSTSFVWHAASGDAYTGDRTINFSTGVIDPEHMTIAVPIPDELTYPVLRFRVVSDGV